MAHKTQKHNPKSVICTIDISPDILNAIWAPLSSGNLHKVPLDALMDKAPIITIDALTSTTTILNNVIDVVLGPILKNIAPSAAHIAVLTVKVIKTNNDDLLFPQI